MSTFRSLEKQQAAFADNVDDTIAGIQRSVNTISDLFTAIKASKSAYNAAKDEINALDTADSQYGDIYSDLKAKSKKALNTYRELKATADLVTVYLASAEADFTADDSDSE